jgi:hypothetical protein
VAVAAGIWPLTAEHMTQMSDNASKALEACATSAAAHGRDFLRKPFAQRRCRQRRLLQSSCTDLLAPSQDDGNGKRWPTVPARWCLRCCCMVRGPSSWCPG